MEFKAVGRSANAMTDSLGKQGMDGDDPLIAFTMKWFLVWVLVFYTWLVAVHFVFVKSLPLIEKFLLPIKKTLAKEW